MNVVSFINHNATNEEALLNARVLIDEKLQKIDAEKQKVQKENDAIVVADSKRQLFADTFAAKKAEMETAEDPDEMWEIAKPVLWENFYGNVSDATKWRDDVAKLNHPKDIMSWTCCSDELDCSRAQIPIPIRVSRWSRDYFLCSSCYFDLEEEQPKLDDIILDRIEPELMADFCAYARAQLSSTKRIKVE
jgi:hypothetical protein